MVVVVEEEEEEEEGGGEEGETRPWKDERKQVAQGQYNVSDTRCPALPGCKSE